MPAFQFPSWYNRVRPLRYVHLVLPAFQFPSWYNLIRSDMAVDKVLPAFQFPSWYNLWGPPPSPRMVLPAFQFPSWYNCVMSGSAAWIGLAGLPIPQLVQSVVDLYLTDGGSCRPSNSPVGTIGRSCARSRSWSCRPSNSPVGTMPKPKHPLRTGGVLVWTEIKMRFGAGKVALRAPFSENRSQKKGLPANTRGADGLTLRVIA